MNFKSRMSNAWLLAGLGSLEEKGMVVCEL